MTSPQTILLVEDDGALRTLTARALRQSGFHVLTAATGAEMWITLRETSVDLIVMDIMLPGTSGLDLFRRLRRESDMPIIFVSARSSEEDRVLGLELGADDYLVKPFSTRELAARVSAVLRRGNNSLDGGAGEGLQEGRAPDTITFDGWQVSLARRELRSASGAIVDLTGAEFDLLITFLGYPQRVLGRERLMELSRARIGDSSDRSIDVLVSRLRRKLQAGGCEPPIVTVRGVGYMFKADVKRG
ncbi:DNA-binding response OmpR family regulator [Novosphingobium chloroacetimidivorans]|uniref:DNA-binding response OmpR family regulator n=1 Tax=Novosphingobium chloroacetimidivorans TaxID=1428314 RepID=A0A7W7K5X4_9SPHN|nr:response regulator transcription factor [Novosphingobium chloroacetimidivorans]MBB4856766.1 DNA-binding response OmpR family regulator [Novosphingobium chloroacetimidivorans]